MSRLAHRKLLHDSRGGTALYVAPLWPAGHLPLKGGDYQLRIAQPSLGNVGDWRKPK